MKILARLAVVALPLLAASVSGARAAEEAASSWTALTAQLGALQRFVDEARALEDPVTVEEGYRFLPRLLRLTWEHLYEYNTPYAPVFWQMNEGYLTNGSNAADATYAVAIIDGRREYVIHGANTAPFMEISAYEAGPCLTDMHSTERGRQAGTISEANLKTDGNGRFSVFLGPRKARGHANAIKTTPATNLIIFRQYRFEPATPQHDPVRIEILNPPSPMPPRIGAEEAYACTARFAQEYLTLYTDRFWAFRKRGALNTLAPLATAGGGHKQGGGMPSGHRYRVGQFDLRAGQSLLIEFDPPAAPYWSLGLNTYWSEVPDYLGTGAHVNSKTARPGADGKVRIVIGPEPRPDLADNWLDTGGRRAGWMVYRQLRVFDTMPAFATTLVDGSGR